MVSGPTVTLTLHRDDLARLLCAAKVAAHHASTRGSRVVAAHYDAARAALEAAADVAKAGKPA